MVQSTRLANGRDRPFVSYWFWSRTDFSGPTARWLPLPLIPTISAWAPRSGIPSRT